MEVCTRCERCYELETMGVWVIVVHVHSLVSQTEEAEYVYRADMYQCPVCQHRLLCQFGRPYFIKPTKEELDLVKREEHFYVRRMN